MFDIRRSKLLQARHAFELDTGCDPPFDFSCIKQRVVIKEISRILIFAAKDDTMKQNMIEDETMIAPQGL